VVHGVWALIVEAFGLAVLLATAVRAWFVKRHTWLLAAPLGFAVCFNSGFALVEGWSAQALMVPQVAVPVIAIGSVGALVVGVVLMTRGSLAMNRAMAGCCARRG
jgi:hypothetical protein